jgi:cytochrome c1
MLRAAIAAALLAGLCACAPQAPAASPIGDARRGGRLMTLYGCGSCHQIPGIPGAEGLSGPPLDHMARRTIIGGYLPNTTPNMVHWIMDPQSVAPGNAMPNLGLTQSDARDVTAYLATLN